MRPLTALRFTAGSLGSNGKIVSGMRKVARNVVAAFARLIPRGQSTATRIVAKRLCAVGEAGPLVYDLTVARHHCYQANGLLVSNSDAFRYLAMGLRRDDAGWARPIKYEDRWIV